MASFEGVRILCFVGDDYEDLELWYPKLRLEEAGAQVTLAGPLAGKTYRGKNGYPATSDADIASMNSADFQGVIVVGGWMPDKLRRDPKVLELVREFESDGKVIASVCHGAWINISAGVVKGYRYTSTPGIKDDMINAGAEWVDAPVITDRHHVSSRRPPDLPGFGKAIIAALEKQLAG